MLYLCSALFNQLGKGNSLEIILNVYVHFVVTLFCFVKLTQFTDLEGV